MAEQQPNPDINPHAIEAGRLEQQIVEGIRKPDGTLETDLKVLTSRLDEYLTQEVEAFRFRTHSETSVWMKERFGENALFYFNALNGTYHKEKFNVCFTKAAMALNLYTDEEARKAIEEYRAKHPEVRGRNRKAAANWLRMGAACLDMPEEDIQSEQ